RQRQVGESVAVHVPHLLAAIAVLDPTEAVRQRLHARPGGDLIPNQLSGALHARENAPAPVVNPLGAGQASCRPRPNMASRSCLENCWNATMVWVRSMPSSLVSSRVTTF